MHQPTVRVLEILELVTQKRDGMRLSDISRILSIPKGTLLPILKTLCEYRYLLRNENGEYMGGAALLSFGNLFSDNYPILSIVRSELRDMSEKFGETYYFGILDSGNVLYLEKVESIQPLRMLINTGRRLPAYATGIGKSLLIDKTQAELDDLYPQGLIPLTKNTVTSISELSRQLSEARELGYAYEVEESMEHIRCFSVPIRKHGEVVAAISVAIPIFRYEDGAKERIIEMLKEKAEKLGSLIEKTNVNLENLF